MKALALSLLTTVVGGAQAAPSLHIWTTKGIGLPVEGPGADRPQMVGSLQKPFVAKAWAAAHPGQEPPRFKCAAGAGCWRRSGHGDLGLAKALSLSCNAYFRNLAADTPLRVLGETFNQEGFRGGPSGPDEAIGLLVHRPILITPARILEAYSRLIREPWLTGESVRQHVLAGLRLAPLQGSAALFGKGGCWAKTGTVPAAEENPTMTSGLVLVIDDAHGGTLAKLDSGTGKDAAAALGRWLQKKAPGSLEQKDAEPLVRVRLFDLLSTRTWRVRNLGSAPVPYRNSFLGPGSSGILGPKDSVGPGLLEVEAPGTGMIRRLEGQLSVVRDREGQSKLIASMSRREYVAGVLAGELPTAGEGMRVTFGAVILRFLSRGHRHPEAEVCDSTHCAWFIGRGPRLFWVRPDRAVQTNEPVPRISDTEWTAMGVGASKAGPCYWSADCGGAPLSPHAVWGDGDQTLSTPPHVHAKPSSWQRTWHASDLEKAFGVHPESLEIQHPKGVWTLVIHHARGTMSFRFDEAHQRLARVLGWDALPSPAFTLQNTSEGVLVHGTGLGHRIGLCLKACSSP